MEELKEEVVSSLERLDEVQLQDVRDYVNDIILNEVSTPEYLVSVMNDIVGADIKERTRTQKLVWGRFIVLSELLGMGWTTSAAGRVFRMNHSTVVHAHQQVNAMKEYPGSYCGYYDMYRKFKKRIRNDKMRLAG